MTDAERGKVVWPPHGEIGCDDALATLLDIAGCDLDLTLYDEIGENGENVGDAWVVTFGGAEAYPDSPGKYGRIPLKALIEKTLQTCIDEDSEEDEPARLLKRLLRAFEEPDE